MLVQTTLKDLVHTKRRKGEKTKLSTTDILSVSLKIGSWIFILGLVALISWSAIKVLDILFEKFHSTELQDISFWLQMSISLGTSAVLWLLPLVFTILSKYLEDYGNNIQLRKYTDLFRIFILETAVLVTVVMKYILHDISDVENGRPNYCWENEIGQEMYRLLVLFFIILVLVLFLFETCYNFAYMR